MRRKILSALVGLAIVGLLASSTQAIIISPTKEQVSAAVAYGEEHKDNIEKIKREYSYPELTGKEDFVAVVTKVSLLKLYSAIAAREGRKMSDQEIEKWVNMKAFFIKAYLVGDHPNFAKYIDGEIRIGGWLGLGGKTIQPVKSIKEAWAVPTMIWPESPSWKIANKYFFSYDQFKGDEKVTFVLKRPEGEEEFKLDLSKYE